MSKILPNIDTSLLNKHDVEKSVNHPLSSKRNKLSFSKDITGSIFSSRKNYTNVFSLSFI
jgi:hypothetical protein